MIKEQMTNYWTTSTGEQIKYCDLTDSHLSNIIKDGYRNPKIVEEALNRKMKVPTRPVDKLSFRELSVFIESFASCAIEGNKLGEEMLDLWQNNKALFLLKLNAILLKKDD